MEKQRTAREDEHKRIQQTEKEQNKEKRELNQSNSQKRNNEKQQEARDIAKQTNGSHPTSKEGIEARTKQGGRIKMATTQKNKIKIK